MLHFCTSVIRYMYYVHFAAYHEVKAYMNFLYELCASHSIIHYVCNYFLLIPFRGKNI